MTDKERKLRELAIATGNAELIEALADFLREVAETLIKQHNEQNPEQYIPLEVLDQVPEEETKYTIDYF